jgi:hypothetical protein
MDDVNQPLLVDLAILSASLFDRPMMAFIMVKNEWFTDYCCELPGLFIGVPMVWTAIGV